MTIEHKIAELIQADIDGELSSADRAELAAALEQSAEARAFHDEMSRLAHALAETPDLDPPWGLRRRILDSITLPARPRLSGWLRPASYGLAVAAGVLMAVGIVRLAPQTSEDMSSLVGTMVSHGEDLSAASSSELVIDVQAVRGNVRLKELDSACVVEFDLESDDAVEIALDLDGTGLSFGGYANRNENAGNESFEASEGKVRMTNIGSHQFVLFLRRAPDGKEGSQKIGVTVNHQGGMVYNGLLESRG